MSFSREFVSELVQDIQKYVKAKVSNSDSLLNSTANGLSNTLGYSNEESNKVECGVLIRRLEANIDKNDNEEWINIMIALGDKADQIQRDTFKTISLCSETLHYVRHRMLQVAHPQKDLASIDKTDGKHSPLEQPPRKLEAGQGASTRSDTELPKTSQPSVAGTPPKELQAVERKAEPSDKPSFAEVLAKRITAERAALARKDQEHLQAGQPSEEVKLGPTDVVANIKRIESDRQVLRARLAYLGDLEPLKSQEIMVTEVMFPKSRKPAAFISFGTLFEYFDSSNKKTYGAKGLWPTIPLVLQPQFCTIYLNKYPNSAFPLKITDGDESESPTSTPPDSPLNDGRSTRQVVTVLAAARGASAVGLLAGDHKAGEGAKVNGDGSANPAQPLPAAPNGSPASEKARRDSGSEHEISDGEAPGAEPPAADSAEHEKQALASPDAQNGDTPRPAASLP